MNYQKDYPQGMSAVENPQKILFNDVEDWRRGKVIPFGIAALGFIYPAVQNLARGVPVRTGIIRYPIGAAVGYFVGVAIHIWRENRMSLRDAQFIQYAKLHEQDLQMPERKKVSELLKPWTPIR